MTIRITEDHEGPLQISEPTVISSTVTGSVTILNDGQLRLTGQVVGDIMIRPGAELVVIGKVRGAVVNEGGAVDIFGFVGRVDDTGATETMISRGAIIGGKRASKPSRFSTFSKGQ